MNSFAEHNRKRQAIEVLRWIGVVPAAILGSFAGPAIAGITLGSLIRLAEYGGWIVLDGHSLALLMTLIFNLPKEAGFVLTGGLMAPRYRVATALVLTMVAIPLSLMVHVVGQYQAGNRVGLVNYVHFSGESFGALLGVALLARFERRSSEHREESMDAEPSA